MRSTLCSLLLIAPAALAAPIDIMLVTADAAPHVADVQGGLTALPDIDAVFTWDASTSTPTALDLVGFEAVLVWRGNGSTFADGAALGDALADYVDAGGGVVHGYYELDGVDPLMGRWFTGGYSPVRATGQAPLPPLNLTLDPVWPTHPILQGVAIFDGGWRSVHADSVTVSLLANHVASWSNGDPLIAEWDVSAGRVVALNFYPVSSNQNLGYWQTWSDGWPLLGNALTWAAGPQPLDVLVLAADTIGPNMEVAARLQGAGMTTQIHVSSSSTPSLPQLQAHDATLVWGMLDHADPVALGDVLADYVDAGGTVVTAAHTGAGPGEIRGRFRDWDYSPLSGGVPASGTPSTLVAVDPTHPILSGVSSFDGGSLSRRDAGAAVEPGATRVADWADGEPLVAEWWRSNGRVVALNFYPPSSDAGAGLWVSSTDGGALLVNALQFGHDTLVPDELRLATEVPAAESATRITVDGGAFGDTITFAASTAGPPAPGPCPPSLGGECLDLQLPITVIGTSLTDPSGRATYFFTPTLGMAGLSASLQAAHVDGADSRVSNPVYVTVQP